MTRLISADEWMNECHTQIAHGTITPKEFVAYFDAFQETIYR